MPARAPDEVHQLFTQYFTAGDLDALVALYEPAAVLLPEPGKKVTGHAAIREALAAFLGMKGKFEMAAPHVIQAGDLAIVFAQWTLAAAAPDGSPIRLAGHTSDVVRRQPDGRWLLAIDNPFGAASAGA